MGIEWWAVVVCLIGFAFLVMRRLNRIGRQIEAVGRVVQPEVTEAVGNEERKYELLREWDEQKQRAAQDRRQGWWGFAIVSALLVAATMFSKH
jgi:hypothetical protein